MSIPPIEEGPPSDTGRHTSSAPQHRANRRPAPLTLVWVWVALMLLLATTVATSFIPLGAGNAVLNIGIAIAKAVLVAVFFMRLGSAPPILRLIAIVGIVTLCLLFLLSGADYLNRSPVPAEWQRAVPSLQAG